MVLDGVTVAVGVKDDVARSQVVSDRIAHTAEVHGTDLADDAVRRLVGVTREDDLCVGAGERR
jgi:hypothetical protein